MRILPKEFVKEATASVVSPPFSGVDVTWMLLVWVGACVLSGVTEAVLWTGPVHCDCSEVVAPFSTAEVVVLSKAAWGC
jgi:hypothetical protein